MRLTNTVRDTTVKQLREAYPDLAKYMPTTSVVVNNRQLPVLTNVTEDLRAAGWAPKEQA